MPLRSCVRRIEPKTIGVLKEAIGLCERHGFWPFAIDETSCRCDRGYALDLSR